MNTPSTLRLLVGSAALCLSGVAAAQVSGAIFTTTPDGAIVNENVHYNAKSDVFLSGGPGPNAPPGAAGLPPGEYYFQVTNPSGNKLLSTDSARNRCVVVGSGGFITNQSCGTTFGPGTHLLNAKSGSPGEYVVQLIPFDDTPNNGGVYKAWMTPVGAYVGNKDATGDQNCGNGCFHGFIPADSKTDNFKVRDVPTFCITAFKLIESKKFGTAVAEGWPIVFQGNTLFTNAEGYVRICELPAENFNQITELLPADYDVIATEVNGDPIVPPTTSVTVSVGKGHPSTHNPIVVWTNRQDGDSGCTKNCFFK
jgi:hypothetical protein